MNGWKFNGSSTTGPMGRYAAYTVKREDNPNHWGTVLMIGQESRLVDCGSYDDRRRLEANFLYCWQSWQVICNRAEAMAKGYAVIG